MYRLIVFDGTLLPEIKAAEFVTDTNDNDGVAKFIEKIQR